MNKNAITIETIVKAHTLKMQRNGWQAILDNFKKYVEGNEYQ